MELPLELAEAAKDDLPNGSYAHVEGRLTVNRYTNKDNVDTEKLVVLATRLIKCEPKEGGSAQAAAPAPRASAAGARYSKAGSSGQAAAAAPAARAPAGRAGAAAGGARAAQQPATAAGARGGAAQQAGARPAYNKAGAGGAQRAQAPAAGAAGGDLANLPREEQWRDCVLDNPNDWFDNRSSKTNPKAPDFKHKSAGVALWLNRWGSVGVHCSPPGVRVMLGLLHLRLGKLQPMAHKLVVRLAPRFHSLQLLHASLLLRLP